MIPLLGAVGGGAKGPARSWFVHRINQKCSGRSLVDGQRSSGKPFDISKEEVWQAYLKVRANKGAAGADGVSLEMFGADLKNNLYKVWNRMSSGAYFPPPVLAVEIPKAHGRGTRMLGIPTIADRIAQTVVAARIEAAAEPVFCPGSFGYRPGRSALDAVGACRENCWTRDWVIDLDVEKFFDSVRRDLILRAVQAVTDLPWVILYVKRWLAAPVVMPDGTVAERDRGTPQGSPVSPVLANLFMHYAFDRWLAENFPGCPFERFADDAVVHCRTLRQAQDVLAALTARMEQVGLRLHPGKTKIVYCRDDNRRQPYNGPDSFTFLGYGFRARSQKNKHGKLFTGFAPAISDEALARCNAEVRSWRLHRHTTLTSQDLARWLNPIVRGWMTYYGRFCRSQMYPLLGRINHHLVRWLRKKYKRLRRFKAAMAAWQRATTQHPGHYAHWQWVTGLRW
jgi:RNA-directed DNA polymerase